MCVPRKPGSAGLLSAACLLMAAWVSPVHGQPSDEIGTHRIFHEYYSRQPEPGALVRTPYELLPLRRLKKSPSLTREVFGYLPYWFRDRWAQLDYSLVSTIAYFCGEVGADGAVQSLHGWPRYAGDPSASADVVSMINMAHARGVRVVLCFINFDGASIHSLVSSSTATAAFIQQSLAIVRAGSGDGVNINFEGVQAASRDYLSGFMRSLADSFHTAIPGSQVSCAPTDFDTRPGDWDIAAINPSVDLFFFQGYGYHYSGSTRAGPVGLLPNTTFWGSSNSTTLITTVLGRIPAAKVVLGVPHFGYRWGTVSGDIKAATTNSTTGNGVPVYYPDALGFTASYGRLWDANGLAPWFRYQSGSQWYQGWYEDAESMTHKYNFVLDRSLMGVGMWALGMDGANHDIWDALARAFGDSAVSRPPPPPQLVTVKDSLHGTNHCAWISWQPSAGAGGYRLFLTTNSIPFSLTPRMTEAQLPAGTQGVLIGSLSPDSAYFIRMIAVDTTGLLVSDSSDTYGFSPGNAHRTLVVDGFDRVSGSYSKPHHPFAAVYGQGIAATGRKFDCADNGAVVSGVVFLSGYDAVFWFSGDESTADRTFSPPEQAIIRAYLEGGGRLFVTGSEIGYDLGRAGSPGYSPEFYGGYLKALYQSDDANLSTFAGVAGTAFSGLAGTFGALYPEEYPDVIAPAAGGLAAMKYDQVQMAAIQYTGAFGSGNPSGKLLYVAFPVETVAEDQVRNAVIFQALEFFDPRADVGTKPPPVEEFALGQNWPNPFNATTAISGRWPVACEVNLVVFDLLGREVAVLAEGRYPAGRHIFSFDGSKLASGIYVYRLDARPVPGEQRHHFFNSKRMILLK